MSASQTSHAVNSAAGSVRAKQNRRRERLRTIKNAILILIGFDAAASFFPTPEAIRIGAEVIALILSVIGITTILRLIWIDRKQTHSG